MSKMTFSDGVTFDTDGPYRVEHRRDGYYMVGGGMLCPVNSYEEGYEMIRSLKERAESRAGDGGRDAASRESEKETNSNG